MTTQSVSRLFALLACLMLCGTAADAQSNLTTYGADHKIVLHSKMTLSQPQAAALRDFRSKAGYFGAAVFHKGGKIHLWVINFHNLETARKFARGECRRIAQSEGEDPKLCELYASALPKSMESRTSRASGIGERGYEELTGAYRTNQKRGCYGAFAISACRSEHGRRTDRRRATLAAGRSRCARPRQASRLRIFRAMRGGTSAGSA